MIASRLVWFSNLPALIIGAVAFVTATLVLLLIMGAMHV